MVIFIQTLCKQTLDLSNILYCYRWFAEPNEAYFVLDIYQTELGQFRAAVN